MSGLPWTAGKGPASCPAGSPRSRSPAPGAIPPGHPGAAFQRRLPTPSREAARRRREHPSHRLHCPAAPRPAGSGVRTHPGAGIRRSVFRARCGDYGGSRPGRERELGRRRLRSPVSHKLRRFSPRRCGHGGLRAERAHARRGRRRGRGKELPGLGGPGRPRCCSGSGGVLLEWQRGTARLGAGRGEQLSLSD